MGEARQADGRESRLGAAMRVLDPRGTLTRTALRLAPRPALAALATGPVLVYDNTKMDVGDYGVLLPRLKAGLAQRGVMRYVDHRETIRGKTAADIRALAQQFKATGAVAAVIALADMGVSPAMVTLAIELEKAGLPTVCLTGGPGNALARAHAYYQAGALPLVPLDLYAGSTGAELTAQLDAALPRLWRLLTAHGDELAALARVEYGLEDPPTAADGALDLGDDEAAIYAALDGWHIGDGLPVIAPTPPRYEAMRDFCVDDPDSVLFEGIGPSGAPLRVRDALVAAVMAGCAPAHAPLVLTALRAMAQPAYNLLQAVTTSFGGGHFVLVSGPLAAEAGMTGGAGCLGPGYRANATIGRAVNLALLNVCRNVPGHADLACLSSPAEFGYCMTEERALAPWPLIHEERYDAATTCVMVLKAEAPHCVLDLRSTRAEPLLETIVACCTTLGSNNAYVAGPLVVLLNPDHARLLTAGGYDKTRLRETIHREAGLATRDLASRGLVGIGTDGEGRRRVTRSPHDVEIVVAGGPGGHSAVILPWGLYSDAVFEVVRRADGEPARTLVELRRVSLDARHVL